MFALKKSSTRSMQGERHCEKWSGKRPKINPQSFSPIMHVKTLRGLSKLDIRGKEKMFVGVRESQKAYRCYDSITNILHLRH